MFPVGTVFKPDGGRIKGNTDCAVDSCQATIARRQVLVHNCFSGQVRVGHVLIDTTIPSRSCVVY